MYIFKNESFKRIIQSLAMYTF